MDVKEYRMMCLQIYDSPRFDPNGLPNEAHYNEVLKRYKKMEKWRSENEAIEFDGMGDW